MCFYVSRKSLKAMSIYIWSNIEFGQLLTINGISDWMQLFAKACLHMSWWILCNIRAARWWVSMLGWNEISRKWGHLLCSWKLSPNQLWAYSWTDTQLNQYCLFICSWNTFSTNISNKKHAINGCIIIYCSLSMIYWLWTSSLINYITHTACP